MRCSSSEPLLDRYVEASLEPARASALAAHLRACAACEELHRRVRTVDALLATARNAELPPDFTFDLMGRVRTMDAPALPKRPLLPLAAFYLVAAWIVAGAILWAAWPGTPYHPPAIATSVNGALTALAQGTRVLWPVEPIALSVVVSVLSIDVLLFAAVVAFYRRVRPRLTAYLAVEGP